MVGVVTVVVGAGAAVVATGTVVVTVVVGADVVVSTNGEFSALTFAPAHPESATTRQIMRTARMNVMVRRRGP